MNETEIIIIGAGAAGLLCARELARAGNKVTVLEARNRIGGRIHTIVDDRFSLPVELGAEFIHGDLPLTTGLLKAAGIVYYEIKGDIWKYEHGVIKEQDDFIEDADLVIKQLKKLPTDISIADFLNLYFYEEKYAKLRKTFKNYVEGYDAADTKLASAFSLLQELLGEDNNQYRIKGGYIKLVDHLIRECTDAGCIIKLERVVKEIRWQRGHVEVMDQKGMCGAAKKAVITLPLGVLKAPEGSIGKITFFPALQEVEKSICTLGYGAVIKIILQFDEVIWQDVKNIKQKNAKPEPSFLFSDAAIPTWWTQLPEKNGMITGWLAGPKAESVQTEADDKILDIALESLAAIFNISFKILQSKLIGFHLYNWSKDEFSRGAYSYETVESKNAKSIITKGVEDTLYFAGEAYHEGPERGTVEAALVSGKKVAESILQSDMD